MTAAQLEDVRRWIDALRAGDITRPMLAARLQVLGFAAAEALRYVEHLPTIGEAPSDLCASSRAAPNSPGGQRAAARFGTRSA